MSATVDLAPSLNAKTFTNDIEKALPSPRTKALQLEPIDRGTCGDGRDSLQRENAQRLSWRPRKPFQRKVRHRGDLPGHENLPEMSRGSFVGFTHRAENCNVT